MKVSADESGFSSSSGVSATELPPADPSFADISSSDVIVDEPSCDSENSAQFPVCVQKLPEAKASIPVEHSLIPYKASPFADMFSAPGWFSAPSARTRSYSTASLSRNSTASLSRNSTVYPEPKRQHPVPVSPAHTDPASVLSRSHSAASLSSTGSSVIYKRPHLSALCFKAYHADPAGKSDAISANLLTSPGISLIKSSDAIFSAAKIVEGNLPNTVDQVGSSIEINNNLNIIIK
ncbi:hypothetical protein BVG19_g4425 [[Candida] boidinii]|nr:hypothetical protein BVG19_g4425 [[Candida] boidinii]OWB49857.1 hypothetical protein B5S27_g1402 [[Candida] boidinii]